MRSAALTIGSLVLVIAGCAGPTPRMRDDDAGSSAPVDAGHHEEHPDAGPIAFDAGPPDAGPADGGAMECPGMVASAPYADLVTNAELTDPATCESCPGAFSGLEELDVGVSAGATTLGIEGAAPGASSCEWYVVGGSCGITHGVMATDPDGTGQFAATLPVFCGTNVVRIVCSNAAGSRVIVRRVSGPACDGRDLRVTLTWGATANDLELHLVQEGGRINDSTSDCTWFTCVSHSPDWGIAGDTTDDPRKDIDDTGPFGPENIFLDAAPAGTYHIYAEYWGSGEPGDATTAITIREATVAEVTAHLAVHDVWYVGTVDFPSGTFTPSGEIIPCQTEWRAGGSMGCNIALPR